MMPPAGWGFPAPVQPLQHAPFAAVAPQPLAVPNSGSPTPPAPSAPAPLLPHAPSSTELPADAGAALAPAAPPGGQVLLYDDEDLSMVRWAAGALRAAPRRVRSHADARVQEERRASLDYYQAAPA